jgi:hypothetical protein
MAGAIYKPCRLECWTSLRTDGVILFAVLELLCNERKGFIFLAGTARHKLTVAI